jgi:hypothetical protein
MATVAVAEHVPFPSAVPVLSLPPKLCVCVCVSECVSVCVCVCVCVVGRMGAWVLSLPPKLYIYIHTYIYIYIHIHIHIHIYRLYTCGDSVTGA